MRASLPRLRNLIREHKLTLLALIEPKHIPSHIMRYGLRLSFSQNLVSQSERIWFFWRDHEFSMLAVQDTGQVVHLTMQSLSMQYTFVLSLVYGHHTPPQRQLLWQSMRDFHAISQLPWIVGGDFNTFRSLDDHSGRSSPSLSALQDFNECIEDSYGTLVPWY